MRYIIMLLFLSFSLHLGAQQERHTKIKSAKIAYMTKELDLSPSESEVFWPLYNKYQEEKSGLYKKHKASFNDLSLVSDEEADQMIEDLMDYQRNQYELSEQFFRDLRDIFPARKVLKFHKADREFKRELLRKAKKKRKTEE